MLLELITVTNFWLVIDPNGARTQWNLQPTSAQISAHAQILACPSDYDPNQIQNYQSDGHGNAVYIAPPAPTPGPPAMAPAGFLAAIQNDPMLTDNPGLIFQMAPIIAIFQADMQTLPITGSPAQLQSHWQSAISTYGATWLTTQVQNMILGYAQTYNIPLVADQLKRTAKSAH